MGRALDPCGACRNVLAVSVSASVHFSRILFGAGWVLLGLVSALAQTKAPGTRLTQLGLEDLMRVEVSTVSRKAEPWWQAPGAVDIVTEDEIRRSGVMTLPDALRLATGVHVGQASARTWGVAIRGFNVNAGNKVNVQLDGRSLFTPFFSGVLWDAQDTLLEDIARIEVMRGPGAALWGTYSLNGFIQILTKSAWETQGLFTTAGGGREMPVFGAVRYGGRLTDATAFRVYAKYNQFESSYTPNTRQRSQPTTDFFQTGFRADTRGDGGSTFTVQGDAYTNKGTPEDHPQVEVSGANLTTHFVRGFGLESEVRGTAYYDYTEKDFTGQFIEFRHSISTALKYRLVRDRHELQLGADALLSRDDVKGAFIFLRPGKRTYWSGSIYAHDTIRLMPDRWALTLGAQALYTNFSNLDAQPTIRLAWTPDDTTTVWGAVSRAVRTPVRLDVDLVAESGTLLVFEGNENLKSESVLAWELGVRRKFGQRLAVALASFVNDYDNIRSYESATSTFMAFPWTFKNTTNVRSSGVEVMLLAQPFTRLFVKASYRYLDFNLTHDPGSGDFRNGFYEANDPRHVAAVTFRGDLPRGVEFDATVRHVSRLPNPRMPAFTTFDARLGWTPTPNWELAVIGRNLSDRQQRQFISADNAHNEIARSVIFKATWRY